MVYIGPARAIGRLETTIKERYDWAIESDKGGESEWVSNHTVEDIEQIVDGLIIGFKFKIAKVDQQWLPLSKNNLADFLLSHEIS